MNATSLHMLLPPGKPPFRMINRLTGPLVTTRRLANMQQIILQQLKSLTGRNPYRRASRGDTVSW